MYQKQTIIFKENVEAVWWLRLSVFVRLVGHHSHLSVRALWAAQTGGDGPQRLVDGDLYGASKSLLK